MDKESVKQGVAGVVALALIILAIKFFLGSDKEQGEKAEPKKPDQVAEQEAEPIYPLIPDQLFKIAVDAIKEHPEVGDAAVSQKGRDLSLTIIVNQSVSEARAKELGDDFVRMVMTNTGSDFENAPEGKQIGSTRYAYLIGIYLADETQVALGAKAPAAKWITW